MEVSSGIEDLEEDGWGEVGREEERREEEEEEEDEVSLREEVRCT